MIKRYEPLHKYCCMCERKITIEDPWWFFNGWDLPAYLCDDCAHMICEAAVLSKNSSIFSAENVKIHDTRDFYPATIQCHLCGEGLRHEMVWQFEPQKGMARLLCDDCTQAVKDVVLQEMSAAWREYLKKEGLEHGKINTDDKNVHM